MTGSRTAVIAFGAAAIVTIIGLHRWQVRRNGWADLTVEAAATLGIRPGTTSARGLVDASGAIIAVGDSGGGFFAVADPAGSGRRARRRRRT